MNAANLQLELERLSDRVIPGRQAAVQNEAMRQISRRLRAEPNATTSVPADRLRRRLR
jgi:hypothetical protein